MKNPKNNNVSEPKITSESREKRVFKPSAEFQRQANLGSLATYKKLHAESVNSPENFWGRQANEQLVWRKPFTTVLNWKSPHAEWFKGGKLNVAENCLDRHLGTARENKAAIIFEGEPGDVRTITYKQLSMHVSRLAHVFENMGINAGDRVAIYLPMVPEAIVAMLACARIGAVHTVIFGGFSAEAIKDRINDCQAKLVITADGGWRRGKVVELKSVVDRALEGTPSVQAVIVLKRTGNEINMVESRDIWWHDAWKGGPNQHKAKAFDSEHPLFILYTSGSTGKPKGVLHTSAGYLLGAKLSAHHVFDLKENDRYFCSADIGWITGHSYVVYGLLANGSTVFLYEGAPNQPEPDRFWQMIDRHAITILYTAPTAIRAFMRWGDNYVLRHRLDSLRLLGSVGEPISPEAWRWYHAMIGKGRCPIVDTWWQTETGSILIATLPGAAPLKPGAAGLPFFGVAAKIVDEQGKEVPRGTDGKMVITKPWPSMLRTLWNDDARYQTAYFGDFPGVYFTGDGAKQDKDGYFWISGRVDDVLNISGHRIGTAEVEAALASHPSVAESAAVGRPDSLKGQALVVFVSLKTGVVTSDALKEELRSHIGREIGSFAKPDSVRIAAGLPKTRSGKIMRRILKEIAAGREVKGDTSTLEDFSVIAALQKEE
ncbi:MAG: acetate--CoA ligase [Opitutus sp.]|nr:acetate--CoA ligase [Opitutus sp.]MCS6246947.1 acetate--CoA ligase [Opitutus sp.]MCS6273168.1 acetate--CoA ligase [Opitutus sp.]MCS6279073.1 acetate--CoA ligase [Opitutus sp.]MCS6298592.1 acetate--CoA ligase [Opitutus sp.]